MPEHCAHDQMSYCMKLHDWKWVGKVWGFSQVQENLVWTRNWCTA